MNKPIQNSVVAGAVLLAAFSANAATVSFNNTVAQYSSTEGNAAASATNAGAVVRLRQPTVTVAGTAYGDGDIVTVTVSGASLRAASVGTLDDTTGASDIACQSGGATQFKLRARSASANQVQYVVRERTTSSLAASTSCVLPAYEVLASSLTSPASVSFNWSAATAAGTEHDLLRGSEFNPGGSVVIHQATSQFRAACVTLPSTARSGTVTNGGSLVGASCTSSLNPSAVTIASGSAAAPAGATFLTSTGGASTSTSFAFRITPDYQTLLGTLGTLGTPSPSVQNLLTVANSDFDNQVAITYSGDFSFLDNNSNGCSVDDLSNGYAQLTARSIDPATAFDSVLTSGSAATVAISSDCRTLTVTGAANRIDSLTFRTARTDGVVTNAQQRGRATVGARVIPAQTIAVSAPWVKGTTAVATGASSAAFAFNQGTSVEVNYMPYGSGISRIVYVTNRTGASGAVSITAYNEAGTACASTNFPAVTLPAGGMAVISGALDAGVATCFGSSFNGKINFVLTSLVGGSSADSLSGVLSNGTLGASGSAVTQTTIGASDYATFSGTVSRSKMSVEVYSAYNVNGNRVTVPNNSNGR